MAATLHKKAEHSLGPVDGLCWVAPQKLHITLTFLGASWPQQLTTLVDCLAQELRNCPAFNCRTGDFCYFPNARKPRVLCLKIHSEALEHLGTLCEQAAASCDFKVDSRKFRPHLTLGRFKKIPNYPPFFNLRSFASRSMKSTCLRVSKPLQVFAIKHCMFPFAATCAECISFF